MDLTRETPFPGECLKVPAPTHGVLGCPEEEAGPAFPAARLAEAAESGEAVSVP